MEGMLPKTQLISLENKTVHFIAPLRVVNKKTCLKDPVDLFTEKMKKKKKKGLLLMTNRLVRRSMPKPKQHSRQRRR